MSTPDEGLTRLAAAVRSARVDRYSSTEKAGSAAGMSRSTWESVEKGRSGTLRTYRLIERALGWETGRAQRILAGEDVATGTRPVEIPMGDPSLRAIVDAASELTESERAQLAAIAEALLRTARERNAASNGP